MSSWFWDLLTLAAELDLADNKREIRNKARRRQRKAKKLKDRRMSKPPQPQPSDDNQPGDCQCPRCADRSNGFRWSVKERTWRCFVCRTPLRFHDGQPELNFDRDLQDAVAGGWRIPDSSRELQRAILLLGNILIDGPRPVVKTRQKMAEAGYGRKVVDRAVSALRITQKQRERPGPLCFYLPEKAKAKVAEMVLEEMLHFVASRDSGTTDDTEFAAEVTPETICSENSILARESESI